MWQRLWSLSIYFCFLIYLCMRMYIHTYLCIPVWFPERERDKLQLACRELYVNHSQSLLPFLIIFVFLSSLLIIDPPSTLNDYLWSPHIKMWYTNVLFHWGCKCCLRWHPKKKKKWFRWVILWKWEFPRARLKHKLWGHL